MAPLTMQVLKCRIGVDGKEYGFACLGMYASGIQTGHHEGEGRALVMRDPVILPVEAFNGEEEQSSNP